MTAQTNSDALMLYGQAFASRMLLGTARYPSLQSLADSIAAARPGMLTIALRRQMAADGRLDVGILDTLKRQGVLLLSNTAGCRNAHEVLNTALMAREVF
jgi:thiazole synthase